MGGFLTVEFGPDGGMVIPAALREAAGLQEGDELLVSADEDGRLILEARAAVKRRLRAQAAATKRTGSVAAGLRADSAAATAGVAARRKDVSP